MKWELSEDQKVLVTIIRHLRMAMVSAEEIAATITEAGFARRGSTEPEDETGVRRTE